MYARCSPRHAAVEGRLGQSAKPVLSAASRQRQSGCGGGQAVAQERLPG